MSKARVSLTINPEYSIEALLPQIRDAVHTACHRHPGTQCEVEDFKQQVVLLLMEDDYRRLRSFSMRSSIKTWLTAVALNQVSNYMRRQKRAISLAKSAAEGFVCQPTQEKVLLYEDRRRRLREVVSQLTAREQELFELLCQDGLACADVAMRMGIKADSVRRRKHALIKKLQELLDLAVDRTVMALEK